MNILQRIIKLGGAYRIKNGTTTQFAWIGQTRCIEVRMEKRFFGMKQVIKGHKVFFDLYHGKNGEFKFIDGFVDLDKDWIEMGAKQRNKIKKLIESHFKGEYVVGNYRNYK